MQYPSRGTYKGLIPAVEYRFYRNNQKVTVA